MDKMISGRIEYEKKSPYNNNVYIGNWFEDRCHFVKDKHNHISTYMADYEPKPDSTLDPAIMWDRRSKGEGCGARLLFDHNGDHYMNNLSTMSDLSFNHFPKWMNGPAKRHWRFRMERWEPEQDYARNFGNITKYGITEYKKQLWEQEKEDPRTTSTSHYQDTFLPPNKEDYMFRRWGAPISNSSIMNKVNLATVTMKLRNQPINCVPPNEDLVIVPRQPRCNPLTWECPDKNPFMPKRCMPQKSPTDCIND